MAEVSFSVGGRSYSLICDDGEEERLKALARKVDAETAQFLGQGAAITEARLLLMAALMLADKLDESEGAAAERSQLGMFGVELADEAVGALTGAAERIEALTPGGRPAATRRKSSAASEAERDLLSWGAADAQEEDEVSADDAAEEFAEIDGEDLAPDGADKADGADEADAPEEADEAAEEPDETAAAAPEDEVDEEAERRARQEERRRRLAGLSGADEED